eukprot:TRINITY_DN94626_c0_g1_i1.p1 TRINITY_DN94626_c0_g1~~TRINITY_DN94626_c0_g1_i1.p1  ORF type:complete len:320 (-),score=40.23 TRINITY_DN94626_c0_g1_i1:61-1020(-)
MDCLLLPPQGKDDHTEAGARLGPWSLLPEAADAADETLALQAEGASTLDSDSSGGSLRQILSKFELPRRPQAEDDTRQAYQSEADASDVASESAVNDASSQGDVVLAAEAALELDNEERVILSWLAPPSTRGGDIDGRQTAPDLEAQQADAEELSALHGAAGRTHSSSYEGQGARQRWPTAFAGADLADNESEHKDNLSEDEVTFVLGPTEHAFRASAEGSLRPTNIRSSARELYFSDVLFLCQARTTAPLSFGSVQHYLYGSGCDNTFCRPCMFERSAGRCIRGTLCDFCHLDVSRQRKRRQQALKQQREQDTALPWQ